MKGLPTDFWAKLEMTPSHEVIAWHPLIAHSADVAAMTEALLTRTILRSRLARLIGMTELSDTHVARLSALAAIHDAGKVNHGFQNKAYPGRMPQTGHVAPIVETLEAPSFEQERLLKPLGVGMMLNWFESEVDLKHFLLATWGHHGRPVSPRRDFKPSLWSANGHGDPVAGLAELGECIRLWFPNAFLEDAVPFPTATSFQHDFNGVLTLADWLGSDVRFFAFSESYEDVIGNSRRCATAAVKELYLDATEARRTLGDRPVDFSTISDLAPYESQVKCLNLPVDEKGSLTVLESDTGSGKTEAALARFVRLYQAGLVDGMYFAVPTRSAATQLHRRVVNAIARAFADPNLRPPVVLAVPGYIKMDTVEASKGVELPRFEVLWPDDENDFLRTRGWAAEHPKKYLAGPIVVGTVDQVLLSTLQVKHAHMRASALLRHFLVVDEVHASDVYMTRLMDMVLDHHLAAGGHALLMSATLGGPARVHLTTGGSEARPSRQEAERTPYPLLTYVSGERVAPEVIPLPSSGRTKSVRTKILALVDDPRAVGSLALDNARSGARVLVIRNRVLDCIATQKAAEIEADEQTGLLFRVSGVAAPHHSRFAPEDRRRLDAAIENSFGPKANGRGVVAVTTQTVEQSLDIDADILITDLCPIDVLLQRIGRLHRHDRQRPAGFEAAECVVIVSKNRDLGSGIINDGRALRGQHGLGTVYQDLRALEAAWRLLEQNVGQSWLIPDDNRKLVERGTHPDVLASIADECGPKWKKHQEYLIGRDIADRQLPGLVGIDRNQPFGVEGFADDLGQIKTRLGRDDYQVVLPQGEKGPFGSIVTELTLTQWQVGESINGVEASSVEQFEGGFEFSLCKSRFRYDRFGVTGVASS